MSTKLSKIVADFSTTLTTKIPVGGTTGSILATTDDDGVTLPTGNYYFTLDGNNSLKEHIYAAYNSGNLTAIKSISRQGVETSGAVREHRVGASVSITDFAHILRLNQLLTGETDLDSTSPLKYDGSASISDDKHLATKKYVDDVAVAGSPKATEAVYGISKLSSPSSDPTVPVVLNNEEVSATSGANKVVKANASGKIDASFGGAASTLATLNGSGKVVEDPANATSTPTASKIPIADGSGKLNGWVDSTDELFGDGSDGDVTISTPTTLTSDKYYNNLILNDDLNAAGYKVFVAGTLTVASGKKIYNNGGAGGNGGNGSAGTGGTAGSAGTIAGSGSLPSGSVGKIGIVGAVANDTASTDGTNGNNGDSQTYSLDDSNGATGGNGGYGDSTPGGTGGTGGTTTRSKDLPKNWVKAYTLIDISGTGLNIQRVSGGSGSGGTGGVKSSGSGARASSGGSGGSGATGGIVFLAAKTITLNGSSVWLEAKGGNGGNAGTGYASGGSYARAGGSGGGAGGNGGIIIFIYKTKTGSATTSVAGGTGGLKSIGVTSGGGPATDGTDGASGAVGTIFEFSI